MTGEKANHLPELGVMIASRRFSANRTKAAARPPTSDRPADDRPAGDPPVRSGEWMMLGLLAVAILGSIAYATVKPRHLPGETLAVAVIGGQPDAAIAAVAAAGGLALRDGALPGSVIARATDTGFIERLRRAGANLIYRIDDSVNCAGAR